MKRMLLTLLPASLLALGAPAAASAPASLLALGAPAAASAHHGHHHSRHHGHHASSARLLNFGAAASSVGTAAGPVQASPTTENAGEVESFENGVLKIKLKADNSVVTGKVTEDTELRCQSATPPSEPGDDDSGDSASGSQGDNQGGPSSPDQFASQHGDLFAHASDNGDQGDDDQGEGSQESCSPTTALVKGAIVREAELELSGAGAVWEKIVIVH
jgi:hypothetical protein